MLLLSTLKVASILSWAPLMKKIKLAEWIKGIKQRRKGRRKGEILRSFPRGYLLGYNPQESPQIKLKLTAEKGKKRERKARNPSQGNTEKRERNGTQAGVSVREWWDGTCGRSYHNRLERSRSISRNSYFIGQCKTKCKGVRLSCNSLTFIFGKGSIFASIALLAATG